MKARKPIIHGRINKYPAIMSFFFIPKLISINSFQLIDKY